MTEYEGIKFPDCDPATELYSRENFELRAELEELKALFIVQSAENQELTRIVRLAAPHVEADYGCIDYRYEAWQAIQDWLEANPE